MNMRHTIYVSALLLAACNSDGPDEILNLDGPDEILSDEILVFAHGAAQCEPEISIESSAQKLVDAGIDVLQSMCGIQTGVFYPAVCGAASGSLLIHEIRSVNLPDAELLGFLEINTLVDAAAGTGYELVDCATGSLISD